MSANDTYSNGDLIELFNLAVESDKEVEALKNKIQQLNTELNKLEELLTDKLSGDVTVEAKKLAYAMAVRNMKILLVEDHAAILIGTRAYIVEGVYTINIKE